MARPITPIGWRRAEQLAGVAGRHRPDDPRSVLRLLTPSPANRCHRSWLSVSDRTYFLERSTNLGVAQTFLR